MTKRPWQAWELNHLEVLVRLGVTYAEIARLLRRTWGSIEGKTKYLGLADAARQRKRQKYPSAAEQAAIQQIITEGVTFNLLLGEIRNELAEAGYAYSLDALERKVARDYHKGSSVRQQLTRNRKRRKRELALKGHSHGTFGHYKTGLRRRPARRDPFGTPALPEPVHRRQGRGTDDPDP